MSMQFFVTGTFFDHHDHLKAGKPQSAEYTFSSRSFSVKSASLAQINSDHSSFFKVKVVQSKDFKRYNFYFERKQLRFPSCSMLGEQLLSVCRNVHYGQPWQSALTCQPVSE